MSLLPPYEELVTAICRQHKPFCYFTPFPKHPFFTIMFGAQECSWLSTDVVSCMINTMGNCTAGIPPDPLFSEDSLLSAPPLRCEISHEPTLSVFPLISPSAHLISIAGSLGRTLISFSFGVGPHIAYKNECKS